MEPLPSVALKLSETFVLWNTGSHCSHVYEGLPQLEKAMENKTTISVPAIPSLCVCSPKSPSERRKVMFVLGSQWNSSQSSDISTFEPLDILSCLQICATQMLPLLGCDIMTGLSGLLCLRGPHPGLPFGPCQRALMPFLPALAEWERALAVPTPLQHALVVVALGTVARWHSLKRSHPSPKALLAPHQPGSHHSKSPALQELPGWESGACFTWLQSPSVHKCLKAFCPPQPSPHLLVWLTPSTDAELWLLVCVLSHPLPGALFSLPFTSPGSIHPSAGLGSTNLWGQAVSCCV